MDHSRSSSAPLFALQWHHDGLAPYIVFNGRRDHGDAVVGEAQEWLSTHFSVASAVEELVKRSGMAERTFKRRFSQATGFAPLEYVQRLRIEDAKRRLERTDAAADEISWKVGYEDPAFFRRLFKRVTGLTPGAYRRDNSRYLTSCGPAKEDLGISGDRCSDVAFNGRRAEVTCRHTMSASCSIPPSGSAGPTALFEGGANVTAIKASTRAYENSLRDKVGADLVSVTSRASTRRCGKVLSRSSGRATGAGPRRSSMSVPD